ncbi:MAG TPA: selenoneine synthase SenA [Polyangia bacterium]|nr:selenoneine synthase SenA [Polyangia bacterium]
MLAWAMVAHQPSAAELSSWVADARARTLMLVADLADDELMGPRLAIVNPMRWEIGHVAWFQEKWVLRHARGQGAMRENGDALYDSAAIPHDVRWDLPLPSRAETLGYLHTVRDRVLALLGPEPSARDAYFIMLTVFHEDMHDEAFTYTRQTLSYRAPPTLAPDGALASAATGALPGDAQVPGGRFILGPTEGDERFVFDNEKWAHPHEVAPFRIARAQVTQSEFAAFVDDGGYRRPDLWDPAGWRWRESERAQHPVYWRRTDAGWERRHFDNWRPLEPHRPVIHVCFYEAEAYCRWAGRRLPTELEWEVAAAGEPDGSGRALAARKRRFPWGDSPPTPERAHLDGRGLGCADVGALPAGDSAFGCRQMIGNVWEWTASDFLPYPGFVRDPYKEYSEPWFGDHKVLRGGCWVTRARLLRNTWRNFYQPHRRDVWAGFRTCAS